MRDLDAARAERQRKIDHGCDALDIGAMDDGVDGQRQAQPYDLCGELALARIGAVIAGDAVGRCRHAVLDRELHMIEAGVGKLAERLLLTPTPEVMRLV